MRKAILMGLMVLALGANAQKKSLKKDSTTNTVKVDSTVQVTDSTGLITVTDYLELNRVVLQELPSKYTDAIRDWFNKKLQQRAKEYMLKPKN